MSGLKKENVGLLFWIVAIAAMIWNLFGVMAYLGMATISPEAMIEAYGQDFADIFETKPAWATGAFAIAVFSGALGALSLSLRKKWALILFIISLIGIIVHDVWSFMAGAWGVSSGFDKGMTVAVLIIAIALIIWSQKKSLDWSLT